MCGNWPYKWEARLDYVGTPCRSKPENIENHADRTQPLSISLSANFAGNIMDSIFTKIQKKMNLSKLCSIHMPWLLGR